VWQALGAASDEVEGSESGQTGARNESWSISAERSITGDDILGKCGAEIRSDSVEELAGNV